MRIAVEPRSPEVLRAIRLRITWDDCGKPSVDVPLGYFFGHGDYDKKDKRAYFSSLLLGANEKEAYSRFPMPFQRKARFEFHNLGDKKLNRSPSGWISRNSLRCPKIGVSSMPRGRRSTFTGLFVAR